VTLEGQKTEAGKMLGFGVHNGEEHAEA